MRILITAAILATSLGACTWVKMAPGAAEVRVLRADASAAACQKRGEISVSVKDRLGPYDRNDIKVRDELETLARNEAPSLQADTIQPKSQPADGEQRFLAFRCAGAAVDATQRTTRPASRDGVETFPIED